MTKAQDKTQSTAGMTCVTPPAHAVDRPRIKKSGRWPRWDSNWRSAA